MRRLSGTHLTIIIVAAMVCLALPATAVGAGIAKVVIAGSNGKTAKVKAGKLQVKATVAGTVKAAQQGTVTTQDAPPAAFYKAIAFSVEDACVKVAQAPPGSALIVDKIVANVWANPTPGVGNLVRAFRDASCSGAAIIFDVNPPGLGNQIVDYDPGIPIPAGGALYADAIGGVISDLLVFGHTVPAAEVPALKPQSDEPAPKQN